MPAAPPTRDERPGARLRAPRDLQDDGEAPARAPLFAPAPWDALDWRPLAAVRNRTKPGVFVAAFEGSEVVCKDASCMPSFVWRLYRRRTLAREGRALARLAGIEGVPRLIGRWSGGLVMEAVPGRMLTTWRSGEPPPPGTFDALDRIVAAAHARGVVLGDVHRRNILVDDDGRVHLVDFETAIDVRRGLGRLVARTAMKVDLIGAARQRRRHRVPLSPEAAALFEHPPWTYRVLKALKRRGQSTYRDRSRTA